MISLINNNEVSFAEYLATHPHLYDGIDLSGNEITEINNHFWDYNVFDKTFSHNYLTTLSRRLGQYHKLKELEFVEQIGDITTNKEILKIAGHVASDSANTSSGWSQSINDGGARHSETDNKDANRNLPMNTTGSDDIDDLVDWGDGASNIAENKSVNDSDSFQDKINVTDGRSLTNIATQWNTNDSERTVIGQQAVKCIENIIAYLKQPKALDWLINELDACFIHIY